MPQRKRTEERELRDKGQNDRKGDSEGKETESRKTLSEKRSEERELSDKITENRQLTRDRGAEKGS